MKAMATTFPLKTEKPRARCVAASSRAVFAFVFSLAAAAGLTAQGGARVMPLVLSAGPEYGLALGEDALYFDYGAGGGLSASMRLPALPFLYGGAGFSYSFLSTMAPGMTVSVIDLGGLAGFHFQLGRSLYARLGGEAGYFMANRNDGAGTAAYNPYYRVNALVCLEINPSLGLNAGVSYRERYAFERELVPSVGVSYGIGGSRAVRAPKGYEGITASGKGIGFVGSRLASVFPVFYKHYDDHGFGKLAIRNFESVEATDLRATVEVKRYMDEPKPVAAIPRLGPGRDAEIELFGLFTDKILEIVEATKLPVSVKLQYRQYGKTFNEEYVATLSVLDRNAITWDDDRKAAAFISAKDPSVLAFAKSVAVSTRELRNPGVNENLQAALAVHEALRAQGMTYVKDPASALETASKQVVDFIMYPQQTLGYNSGKCGDLTVLYCSLLEAVGVSTALITVPGHILMAADLEMAPDQAARAFSSPEDLILKDGKTWLPIETTMRTAGFAKAWQEGARAWREGAAKGTAAFYAVHDAWKAYQPVALSGAAVMTAQKDPGAASRAFRDELAAYVEAETGPRAAALQAEIKKSGKNGNGANPALYNKLGVLYARYGLYDKAAEQFNLAIAAKGSGSSAYVNMGNIHFLRGKYAAALDYFKKALAAVPNDSAALLAAARSHAALGEYGPALEEYSRLKVLDPALAAKHAYLGKGGAEGTREADAAAMKGEMVWQE
jgi:hypothetical protein